MKRMGWILVLVQIVVAIIGCYQTAGVKCCTVTERDALLAMRSSLEDRNPAVLTSWSGSDCCNGSWYGVNCDPSTGRVSDINLRGESQDPIFNQSSGYMNGTISAEICKLDALTTLIMADWKGISGSIPSCIPSNISDLNVLDLSGNSLTGSIPEDFGSLQKLKLLNLADNALSGGIPASLVELGGSLTHLDLRGNQLNGSIPADFGKLNKLSRALLGRNQFEGPIPSSIDSINMPLLADLDLSMNQLSGSIPQQLGTMPVLSTLYLDNNALDGLLPASLVSNTTGLSILNVSRNSLGGYIPDTFGPHCYFTALDLSYNELKGSIPTSLASVEYVGHLDLSHNHLCGSIPASAPFDSLDASCFADNDCLCGNPLQAC